MNDKALLWLLSAAVVLLAGVSLGQYMQRTTQTAAMADIKAELLAELRHSSAQSAGVSTRNVSGRQYEQPMPEMPAEPPVPLSTTQYWISNDYSDDKPFGFSAWIEMVPGGNFILEKCSAPDYSDVEVTAEMPIERIPECEQLISTKIATINDTEIMLKGGRALPLKLEQDKVPHRLEFALQGQAIVFVPGSKNTLWTQLPALPSVRKAYQKLWDDYLKLRNEMEEAGSHKPVPE
jgi:hypothetical protein